MLDITKSKVPPFQFLSDYWNFGSLNERGSTGLRLTPSRTVDVTHKGVADCFSWKINEKKRRFEAMCGVVMKQKESLCLLISVVISSFPSCAPVLSMSFPSHQPSAGSWISILPCPLLSHLQSHLVSCKRQTTLPYSESTTSAYNQRTT